MTLVLICLLAAAIGVLVVAFVMQRLRHGDATAHAAELASLKEAHAAEVASLKEAHAAEVASLKEAHTAEISALKEAHAAEIIALKDAAAAEGAAMSAELAKARAESDAQREIARLAAADDERFGNLARKALAENAETLMRHNAGGLQAVLEPVKENLEAFRRAMAERTERDSAERASLADRMRELMQLNATIGQEARRLTDALRGNAKVQGDWGEMMLANILERCGLRRGIDYSLQETSRTDDGRALRPDAVINYTEGRKIIIDSKVSIQSYLAMLNADTPERRTAAAKEHVLSVRKHVAELRNKNYQDYVGDGDRIDFVLMFIPHEGAYIAAMQLDDTLWENAVDSRVMIISPTHLMSVVKLIEQVWRHDRQNKNALEIARQGGAMLDKLRGFLEDMDKMDKAINAGRDAWNNAYAKLATGNGNLMSRAASLRDLGAKAKKELPARYMAADESVSETEGFEQ